MGAATIRASLANQQFLRPVTTAIRCRVRSGEGAPAVTEQPTRLLKRGRSRIPVEVFHSAIICIKFRRSRDYDGPIMPTLYVCPFNCALLLISTRLSFSDNWYPERHVALMYEYSESVVTLYFAASEHPSWHLDWALRFVE